MRRHGRSRPAIFLGAATAVALAVVIGFIAGWPGIMAALQRRGPN
jgi:hypothetical protein